MKKTCLTVLLCALILFSLSQYVFANSNHVLKVGISADYYPFEYCDNNTFSGFDVDVIQTIASQIGYDIEFCNMPFDALFSSVENGDVDCAISGIVARKERKNMVDFTIPYINFNGTYTDMGITENFTEAYSIAIAKESYLKYLFNDLIASLINDGTISKISHDYNLDINLQQLINEADTFVRSSHFYVKDAWVLSDEKVLVLMENGDLYSGKSIDEQSPELLAEKVSDVKIKFVSPLRLSPIIATGKILYSNGDVSTILYKQQSYQYGEKNLIIEEPASANAKKISFEAYIDNDNNLVHEGSVVMKNVKELYYSDSEKFAITASGDLYVYSCDESSGYNKDFLLSDTKSVFSESLHKYVVLRENGDLYYLNKGETPIRIGTGVKIIEDVILSNQRYIYYINSVGALYYCDIAAEEMQAIRIAEGIVEICDRTLTPIAIDRSGNRYSINWRGTYGKIYGYKKYFDYEHYEDMDGFLCSADIKYNIKDVKKVISNGDMQFILKSNGQLWATYRNNDNKVLNPFLTSFSQKRINVIINNKKVTLETKIQMVNNRSMYPFRECLENMGATVLWDEINKIAIGEYNGKTIEFPIGKKEYYVNGIIHTMDVASYVDNSIGRTYIPIRYAAEALGFTVDWCEKERENTISIYK